MTTRPCTGGLCIVQVQRIHTAKDNKPPLPKIAHKPFWSGGNLKQHIQSSLHQESGHTNISGKSNTNNNNNNNNNNSSIHRKSVMLRVPPPPKVVAKPKTAAVVGGHLYNCGDPTMRAKSCNINTQCKLPVSHQTHLKDSSFSKCLLGSCNSTDYAEKMRKLREASSSSSSKKHVTHVVVGSNQTPYYQQQQQTPAPVNKLTILNHYGNNTLAEASSKLNAAQVEFIETRGYIGELRAAFPKTSVNLNTSMRRVYIFGDRAQVIEAKERLMSDVEHLASADGGVTPAPLFSLPRSAGGAGGPRMRAATVVGYDNKYSMNNNNVVFLTQQQQTNNTSNVGEVNFLTSNSSNTRNAGGGGQQGIKVVNKETFNNFITSLMVKYN
jgi:hypothetical protein